jgi:GAF domain-containing protein
MDALRSGAGNGGVGRDPLEQARSGRLAEEQAALRRAATLVAHAAPPEQVFAAVAEEVGGLLEVDYTVLIRSDPEDMITVVGATASRLWAARSSSVALPGPGPTSQGILHVSTN